MRGAVASAGWVGLLGVLLLGVLRASSPGCGIEWSVPLTHFGGVDAKGHVCYSEQIGQVDMGEGLKLPLIINFRSDRESASPYLGKGWILALLDSNFVQTGENAFLMTQPDGWVRPFYRGKASDSVLDGGVEWKAEIKESTITAWAGCGWKLTYSKGKIAALETPKGRQLQFIYTGNKVTEIRENGTPKLTVDIDPVGGSVRALQFNGRRVEIGAAQKPKVQRLAGQNVVAGMESSLGRLSGPGMADEKFEFATNEKLEPTLRISRGVGSGRLFAWDPATRLISMDGDWTYQITPGKDSHENAAIQRTNNRAESEFWHLDGANGKETIGRTGKGLKVGERGGGGTYVATHFLSGVLNGKIRREEFLDGQSKVRDVLYSYDDTGNLLRKMDSQDGNSTFAYKNDRGLKIVTESKDGAPVSVSIFDAGGNLRATSVVMSDPEKQTNHLDKIISNIKTIK